MPGATDAVVLRWRSSLRSWPKTAQAYVASAITTGTAACFCSAPTLSEERKVPPRYSRRSEQAMRGVDPTDSFVWMKRPSSFVRRVHDYAVMERTADAVVMPRTRAGAMSARGPAGKSPTPWSGNVHHGDVISHKTEKQLRLRRIRPGLPSA